MSKKYELEGKQFGYWTAIKKARTENGRYGWLCRCKCGTERIIKPHVLFEGRSQSCGCKPRNPNNLKHGAKSGGKTKRLYRIWIGMKDRCINPKSYDHAEYAARGISICDEWKSSYVAFEKWALESGYDEKLTIDRIDVNGNYEPSNCRWADDFQQARNRRNCRYLTIDGETKAMAEWVEIYNTNYNLVRSRLNYGWDAKEALTKPARKMNKRRNEE